jgi:DNA polymerase I-like protein with 3'-5' exonuclease and polymerase domains
MPRWKRYKYDTWAALALACFENDAPWVIAVDTETYGFAWDDPAFCATVSWRSPHGAMRSAYLDLDDDDHGHRLAILMEMLGAAGTWVFHNAKFDLQKLELQTALDAGWRTEKRIEDTNILHALLDENDRHGLKHLAKKLLGEETNEEEVLKKVRRKLKIKKDDGYHLLPRNVVAPYAMKDTEFTLRLYEYLRPRLPEELEPLYAQELVTMLSVMDIEARGMALDVPYLKDKKSEYGAKLMKLDIQLQKLAVDESVPPGERTVFNPNSVPQIKEAFLRLGMGIQSTDKNALTEIADTKDNHPEAGELAATLLEHRTIKKIHGTYLVGMLDEERDGIIHPNFNLTLPRTGRMSSSAASNN